MIGCEDRLRNDLYCVGWGVKLYSLNARLYHAFMLTFVVQLLRKWESRERKKTRDYEKEKDREKERKSDESKEARRLKEFFEDYDDERDDVKFYKCVSCRHL